MRQAPAFVPRVVAIVALLALVSCAGPTEVPDPDPPRIPRVGYLAESEPCFPWEQDPRLPHFQQGMLDLGYVDGQNVEIVYRFAAGDRERLFQLASELAVSGVDVIVLGDAQAVVPAMRATKTIPLVMTGAVDPVGTGYIQSLSRPGGNVTGVTSLRLGTAAKRLELLKELVPSVHRVAVFWQDTSRVSRASEIEWREIRAAASTLGIELQSWEIVRGDESDAVFVAAAEASPDAALVLATPLVNRRGTEIMMLAESLGIPVIATTHEWASLGALITLSADYSVLYRRAAVYVGKLLRGANAAELAVEQPVDFVITLNTATASRLNLAVPESVLAQVTRFTSGSLGREENAGEGGSRCQR